MLGASPPPWLAFWGHVSSGAVCSPSYQLQTLEISPVHHGARPQLAINQCCERSCTSQIYQFWELSRASAQECDLGSRNPIPPGFVAIFHVPSSETVTKTVDLETDVRGTRTHLVHKLQLLPAADQPVGVDETAGHGLGVEDHVPGHAHQNVPVVSRVGETAHRHAEERRERQLERLHLDTGRTDGRAGTSNGRDSSYKQTR